LFFMTKLFSGAAFGATVSFKNVLTFNIWNKIHAVN
jgi:hypothetical protein